MTRRGATVEELIAVMETEKVLDFSEEDLRTVVENTGFSLIARHCIPEKYKRDGFMKVIKRLWGSNSTTYAEIGFNAVVVRFSTEVARDKVLNNGPWLYEDWAILVAVYEDAVPLSHIKIRSFRMWIHLYNLPLGCFTKDFLPRVASAVGEFLEVACLPKDQGSEMVKASFAKVLVEVDVNNPIVPSFMVRLPGKEPFRVYVRYPRLPKICFKCGMLLHETAACFRSEHARDAEGMLKFGLWLKDNGSLQMPPPVQLLTSENIPKSDPLDGTLGAIIPRHVHDGPLSLGLDSNDIPPDENMQGNTSDLGKATHNFSKALMQYMGTEYEALFSSSMGDGRWMVEEHCFGEDENRVLGFNHDFNKFPVSGTLGGVWTGEPANIAAGINTHGEHIDSFMNSEELEQLLDTCTAWHENPQANSIQQVSANQVGVFSDKMSKVSKVSNMSEEVGKDAVGRKGQEKQQGIVIYEERARGKLAIKHVSEGALNMKDKGKVGEPMEQMGTHVPFVSYATLTDGSMGNRPMINITKYPNIDPYQIKSIMDWSVAGKEATRAFRFNRSRKLGERRSTLRVRPQSFKRRKIARTFDINEVPEVEETVESSTRGVRRETSSSDSAASADGQRRQSK